MSEFLRAVMGYPARLRPYVYPASTPPDAKKGASDNPSSSFSMLRRWLQLSWWSWSLFWWRKEVKEWRRVNG